MHQRFWSNPEWKKSLFFTAIAACLATAIAFFYLTMETGGLKNGLVRGNSAAAGILLEKHPELREDIIEAFTREAGGRELDAGLAAAAEYGYNESLPVRYIPILNKFTGQMYVSVGCLFLGFFLLFSMILYRAHVSFYRKVRETAQAAERIVEGDFSSRLGEGEEGDLSKLAHQFNQMAQVLELSLEKLRNEKTYLRDMVSDISHQLKTPLSSIKLYNDILQNATFKDPEEQRRFLQRTGEQIERMEWLVKNLLLLARLESGVIEFNYVTASVYDVLENAVETLRDKWETAGIHLSLDTQDKEIVLRHDPSWLMEAVSNIVKNSIEHTPQGGNIEIHLEATPVMVRMIFKDDGEGIASEDLPHIFRRFYKGRGKTAGSGTGIGLALAKAIVENHGGIISVSSQKGRGTSFVITFSRLLSG